jgi:hypothetical protein
MPKRGCLGIPLSLIEALNTTKIPIPGKRGRKVGVLGILISLIVLCCAGIGIYGAADVSLRAAGVLPTLTLTPSVTTEPTATSTSSPTYTATATASATPTSTATRTPTATASSTPTRQHSTATPLPSPTSLPTATPVPVAPTATRIPPTVAPPTASPPTPIPPTAAPPRDYLGAGIWWCPNSLEGAAYVGSVGSDAFHYLGCSSVNRIAAHNRICYESREAAIAFGKRPCQRCYP